MGDLATPSSATRVGWCPGALRPMRSGDGLLVRVKPHGGVLGLTQAQGVASLAERHGNGQIDLTGRANLQIRGVSEATLAPLQRGLGDLGLLDPDPEAEAVRNIVASPLAGLDPSAAVRDLRPMLSALEFRLASDPNCRRLPAKWSIVVDDGGALSLDDVAADLRFRFVDAHTCLVGIGEGWAATGVGDLATVVSDLAAFVAARRPLRMREIVAEAGVAALFAAAGLSPTPDRPALRPPVSAAKLLGADPRGLFVGVAPPFGSLLAADLAGLVTRACQAGARDLRLTPWRVLLVTFDESSLVTRARMTVDASGGRRECFSRDLAALGLIVDRADPRLRVVACTGAPGCHRATVPTRAVAARLAPMVSAGPEVVVHVSGCEKGCARPGATPWTLVGRGGRYDLVPDGIAADAPVARGLSFAEAAAWVRGAMQSATP